MSKFEQFFSAGGGSSYLGVPYPKASTEYKEVGNVGMYIGANGDYAVKSLHLPIAGDPYTHISIATSTGISLTRGRNAASSSVVWTLNDTTQAGAWDNLWFNPINDDVYIFNSSDSTGFASIKKVALSTAVLTTIFTSNTILNPFANRAKNGVYFAPRDPLNPDTCIWDAVGDGGTALAPYLTHLAMDASNNTEVGTNLTVDPVTPQSVITPVQYVTADRKIILGGWTRALGPDLAIGFFVTRGSSRQYVEVPYDGNLPLSDVLFGSLQAANLAIGQMQPPGGVLMSVLGTSVAFSVKHKNTTYLPARIVGKRLFDRVDFDRWLTAVCDAHNMPTGVGYF